MFATPLLAGGTGLRHASAVLAYVYLQTGHEIHSWRRHYGSSERGVAWLVADQGLSVAPQFGHSCFPQFWQLRRLLARTALVVRGCRLIRITGR